MKIAILGGAFNPVHVEHVNLALAAKQKLCADKVIIVPTNLSPHKSGKLTVKARDRLNMCRLAFEKYEGFEVSDCEIKRGGISYTYITLRKFKKLYPAAELYFIMGADMLRSFPDWKEPREILKCATLAVCGRENSEDITPLIKSFTKNFSGDIINFGYTGKKISSTAVRTLAALKEDFSALVPEEVKNYILKKELYCLPELKGVKELLTRERWEHTVRVALFAAEAASRFNVFEYDAIVAAALHDCAKYLGENSPMLSGFVFPRGVPQPVMHQYTGAYVAEHTFGVKDEGVLNAIKYHTSGRENMSPLEKLIFLSDMLETGRNFEGVERLRAEFEKDCDKCLLLALQEQLNYLKKQNKPVYPLTERAYGYLKERLL